MTDRAVSPEDPSVPLLDLTEQYGSIRAEIDAAVARVVSSQSFILGPEVEAFEEAVAEHLEVAHAIGVASGTDALLLLLKALDLDEDAEVVVPAFTFFATAGAVWNAGLRPVFCDVDPETFNVTSATVEAAWTDRTRAVIAVDLFGQMAPMDEVEALARRRGGVVVEDAAQAIGAWRRIGRPERGDPPSSGDGSSATDGGGPPARVMAGAAGTAAALSFFPTKNLGGFGDGGMVTTDDDALAERVRKLRVHGGRQMYHHEMVGTNSRLDAVQAAVLRAKLPHLERWCEARRAHAGLYDELLADLPEVVPPRRDAGNHHVFNQYTVRVQRRDELRAFLSQRGIGSGVYYPVPLHLQPCFAELGPGEGDLPASETLAGEVLSLPVYPELGEPRLRTVVDAVRTFYGA